ncbi:hypothetical protein [Agromyces sp. GXS1127]|uniref:hypothetical protein n=1 Tax=Agromyces sp. GXS1127 TaxID=3424181 RepID=UPI003D31F532
MGTTDDAERRSDAVTEAMRAGQAAAYGDGIVDRSTGPDPAHGSGTDSRTGTPDGSDEERFVEGGPIDAGEDAGGSRAGIGEVAADRARARDAREAQEEEGLAPGESD